MEDPEAPVAEKPPKPAKEPKLKQQRLHGMTPPQIKKLQDKADEVKDHEQDRLEAQQAEIKARGELLEIMKELKLKHYLLSDDMEVVIETTEEKAFVRRPRRKKKTVKAAD